MAYTFGGGTGWRIATGGFPSTFGANSSCGFIYLWFYITTFTSTRVLWGQGNVATNSELHLSGTTELEAQVGRATTADKWLSTDAALALNTWYFVAQLFTMASSGTNATDLRLWLGGIGQQPRLLTIGKTTGSGNGSGSASNFVAGNRSGGALSFQGKIQEFGGIQDDTVGAANTFGISTLGAISAEAEALTYDRLVHPLWAGDYAKVWANTNAASPDWDDRGWHVSAPMGADGVLADRRQEGDHRVVSGTVLVTVTSATAAHERPRRPYVGQSHRPVVRSGLGRRPGCVWG